MRVNALSSALKSPLLRICLLVSIVQQANGQAADSSRRCTYTLRSAWHESLQTEKTIWTKVGHIQRKDLNILVPVVLGTGLVLLNDQKLYSNFQEFRVKNKLSPPDLNNITHMGEGPVTIGIAGGFYLTGLLSKNEKLKETGIAGAEALIHASIIVTATKYIFSRERPQSDNHQGNFEFFPAALNYPNHNSFPSGHTTTIWSLATVIATQYKETGWVPALAYTSAGLCGISRILLEKHWPGDVLAGSLLGYAIGRTTLQIHRKSCRNARFGIDPGNSALRLEIGF